VLVAITIQGLQHRYFMSGLVGWSSGPEPSTKVGPVEDPVLRAGNAVYSTRANKLPNNVPHDADSQSKFASVFTNASFISKSPTAMKTVDHLVVK
jgi:hypothetical protein